MLISQAFGLFFCRKDDKMIAIISKGGKTAHVQLPAEQKQLAGALVYLGENHASDYELKYNEENRAGLKISLDCHGLVENAIAKSVPNR